MVVGSKRMRSPCALTCTPVGGMPTSRSAAHNRATRSGGQACGRRKQFCRACEVEVEEPAAPMTTTAQGAAEGLPRERRAFTVEFVEHS